MAEAGDADREDDWDTPPRIATIPELHLDGFDGPMDLLLDLAERQRFDLGRISVLDLVEQFVAAMDTLAGRVTPERQAGWLVLATQLVLLRSRLMLPASPAEAQDAEQDAVRQERRLEERLRMRAAVAWLEARPQLGRDTFARPPSRKPGRTETTMALMEACLVVLRGPNRRPEAAPVYRPVLVRLWRVEQALARIRQMLAEDPQAGSSRTSCQPWGRGGQGLGEHQLRQARGALAGTFVACLELARQGEVEAEQDQMFETVQVRQSSRGSPLARSGGGFALTSPLSRHVLQIRLDARSSYQSGCARLIVGRNGR